MLGKSRNIVFFPMIPGSGGLKSRLVKAAGTEPPGQMRNEQWHVAVAQSTLASQNAQSTPCSDHSLKLGCGKMAHRCGEKHIYKSKWTKHTMFGPLFEVGMWENGTSLWREAHLQVKIDKRPKFGPLFEVGMWENGAFVHLMLERFCNLDQCSRL